MQALLFQPFLFRLKHFKYGACLYFVFLKLIIPYLVRKATEEHSFVSVEIQQKICQRDTASDTFLVSQKQWPADTFSDTFTDHLIFTFLPIPFFFRNFAYCFFTLRGTLNTAFAWIPLKASFPTAAFFSLVVVILIDFRFLHL